MKAVRFHTFGTSDVLRYEEVEVPVPAPDQVRIRVAATSFNPVDAGIRGGFLQQAFPVTLPHTPGIDVAGTIDALGAAVTDHRVGEQVIGYLPMLADGAAADYVVAPAHILAPAPASIPLADAAALPVVGLTAWQALFEHARLQAGQRLLIHGAGGAVGGYAVQLARHTGAHVIATASPRSVERVRAAGADELLDYTATTVADLGDSRPPLDVVLNLAPIAPSELSALARLVRSGGLVLTTVPSALPHQGASGQDASGQDADGQDAGGVRRVAMFVRSDDVDQLRALAASVDAGELHVDVAQRVPLPELPAIHARSDAGALSGKVIVVPQIG